MPLYMDQHILPGVKAKDVAEAHRLDMMVQGEHGCQCMTYWVDEKRGNVFCLIEAPDKESVAAMHQQAHGLVPNKVIEVNEAVVESFLGRITDPAEAVKDEAGLKVFEDSSLRVLLMIGLIDPVLYANAGYENFINQWHKNLASFRKMIAAYAGREVACSGPYLLASFSSIKDALYASLKILPLLNGYKLNERPCIVLEAGEPVTGSADLFGDTIEALKNSALVEERNKILLGSKAAELLLKNPVPQAEQFTRLLKPDEEKFLSEVLQAIHKNYPDPGFNIESCCRVLAMSASQFYRKAVAVFGVSPNHLLSKIRLQKAKSLLQNRLLNVSQVSFDTGFSSPSYFSKCFKKQFGLLPQAYQQQVSCG